MIWAFIAFAGWLVLANLAALISCPIRNGRAVLALVATGIPILGWLTWSSGPTWGVLALAIGAIALRWPFVRLATARPEDRTDLREPAE
jgi:hypothetical protein